MHIQHSTNDPTLTYIFDKREISDRTAFRREFLKAVIAKTGHLPGWNGFAQMLLEIAKNIFDHAGGDGICQITVVDTVVAFYIADFGKGSYDLKDVARKGSSKAGNGINYGVGICQGGIREMARSLNIDLILRTDRGFRYAGVWRAT